MISLFKWFKWWFWETRRCHHSSFDECHSRHYDFGRHKGWWCKKCGKMLYNV